MRSRPARDAIQFTLDVDAMESTVTKNKSKAEMDAEKRLRKKRVHNETQISEDVKVPESMNLNKKRKTTESKPLEEKTKPAENTEGETTEKPWEGK